MKKAVALLLALVLCGACDWTYGRLDNGHQPCGTPVLYRINPAGFSQGQMRDLVQAADYTKNWSGIDFKFAGYTTDSWHSGWEPPYILIEHRSVNGNNAWSKPINKSGNYSGGMMWFDPVLDIYPTGVPINYGPQQHNATYLKFSMHEWLHQVGLSDQYGHSELLLGNPATPTYGGGDLEGMLDQGCFTADQRAYLSKVYHLVGGS